MLQVWMGVNKVKEDETISSRITLITFFSQLISMIQYTSDTNCYEHIL